MIENLELKLKGNIPVTRAELFELVSSWGRTDSFKTSDQIDIYKKNKKECYDLSNLNVSQINDMSSIFDNSLYNGDLSKWDVSNCKNMILMFFESEFNNNSLKDWNTSSVINFLNIFKSSEFNGDLSNWNFNSTIKLEGCFFESKFNNNSISNWDISSVANMDYLFYNCPFDGDISNWNFNQDVSCNSIFHQNINFKNKYNNGNQIPNHTKYFLKWFEQNREKIRDINTTKEEVLDFFSFDNENMEIKD